MDMVVLGFVYISLQLLQTENLIKYIPNQLHVTLTEHDITWKNRFGWNT
jgi:hypothetical protein